MEVKTAEAPRAHQAGFSRYGANKFQGGRPGRNQNKKVEDKKTWVPITNLGRLVKAGCIQSIEEIFLYSLAIKEVQIVDYFFGKLKPNGEKEDENDKRAILADEVMGIKPVQKQSSSGQRTRFKAFVIVGDSAGHVGYGTKCDKEVATAIRGALTIAKLSIIPVRRGYWGNKIGKPHTVPMKVSGKCASVKSRLVPAPRGTGIVGSPVAKKVLNSAGVSDCFTCTSGHSRTSGNFISACFSALKKTYEILTPDLWYTPSANSSPLDVYAKVLENSTEVQEKTKQQA